MLLTKMAYCFVRWCWLLMFEGAAQSLTPYNCVDASGGFPKAIEFVGDMTFVESIVAILKAGKIRVELIRLPLIETAGCHRRELAEAAREAIASALDSTEMKWVG